MSSTQTLMGAIAALLIVVVVLLVNQQHHTVGDSLHEAVQEMKH